MFYSILNQDVININPINPVYLFICAIIQPLRPFVERRLLTFSFRHQTLQMFKIKSMKSAIEKLLFVQEQEYIGQVEIFTKGNETVKVTLLELTSHGKDAL